jgi:short-subunit dehydrogenase
VNLIGTANALAAVMPSMIARSRGQIAIVSSVAGYRGLPRAIAYSATKAALIAMAESLKFDLDRAGVMVNVVNPGFVKTPLTDRNDFPMPFLMRVEDASRRIVEGLASGRFEVCFPRRFAYILKAMRLVPYALYFPLVGRTTGRR